MEFWNTIVNAGLLGSSKKQLSAADLPCDVAEFSEAILTSSIEPEEKYLQLASLIFNYRLCGVQPVKNNRITLSYASLEEKPYCTSDAIRSLKDVVYAENNSLLHLWLQLAEASSVIVSPELIPNLFSIAEKNKTLRSLIKNCCGKRGEWLSQFNSAWNFSQGGSDEELWQTGTAEQRKIVLAKVRFETPSQAIEWLMQCWSQENANTKAELLKVLAINSSKEDIVWLESLLNEKSQKVKEEAWNLLKQIPESFIVKQYEDLLKQSISVKNEKAMFGLVNKSKLEIHLPSEIQETIFKSGIDKLSSNKTVSDEEYILYQILQFVPPSSLEQIFNLSVDELLAILNKDDSGKKWLPAIASSIARFKNKVWAKSFATIVDKSYQEIASQLVGEEQLDYLLKHITNAPEETIMQASALEMEWSVRLTTAIIQHTSKNPYQYNRQFYNQNISLIPVKVKNELLKISVDDPLKPNWENMRDHLMHLINLKEQVLQSFSKSVN